MLLLDEPLGALDLQAARDIQNELKRAGSSWASLYICNARPGGLAVI